MQKEKKKGKIQRFNDIQILEQRIKKQTPKTGQYFYDYKLEEAYKQQQIINQEQFHQKYKINYSDLPISKQSLKGLNSRGFNKMTQVQRCSIPHALADRDLLVSSRTGSGKTLAYLVPLIQKLYRHRFIPMDGLGAIVLLPVRELAMQVFQVLNSFSQKFQISVGLIIGGKDVKYQQQRIKMMNVLICTPGRLLQHLQETYGFETNNLQMIVLDEADVMLQMGFKEPLKAILSHLPRCQTLMFSATMTKDISALASMCTNQPQKILLQKVSLRQQQPTEQAAKGSHYQTPAKLTQYYMVVPPEQKINTFYSFLKSHNKQKIIVFLSTCKQVRFLYESFRKFKLGSPLYELQGHQKQKKRMAIYFTFCEKKHGVLLCTNIAARGLDFPLVDWVIQIDIPDNPNIYVHRVGRTARYKSEGRSLVLVSEHQKTFIDELKNKGLQIHKINQNPQRFLRIQSSLQSICSQHQDVKYLAQRALISYLKFVYKAQNKQIFNLKKINMQKYSQSYGLLSAPNINIKGRQDSSEDQQNQDQQKPKLSKIQKLRQNQKLKKAQIKQLKVATKQQQRGESQGQDEQLFTIKSVVKHNGEKAPLTSSKRQLKKIKNEGHFDGRNKIYFGEDGSVIEDAEYRRQLHLKSNRDEVNYNVIQTMQNRIQQNKQEDDVIQKERRKDKRRHKQMQKQIKKRGQSRQAVLVNSQEQLQEEFQ